jgi:hypothetical protein
VVQDLITARLAAGGQIVFQADDVSVRDFLTGRPRIRYRHEGARHDIECDILAGCDGFHGVCRRSIPNGRLRNFERASIRLDGWASWPKHHLPRRRMYQPRTRPCIAGNAVADAAPPVLRSHAVRTAHPGSRTRLCVQFARRVIGAGGELRRLSLE